MTDRPKVTIYDIAAKAGTSASTVSYALNGSWRTRRIKPDTVERIQRIATESGYRVNLQARGLRKASSGLAGMILPEHDTRFFSELSQAFAVQVRARGGCPAIVLSGRDPDAQQDSIRTLLSYNVDRIVIAAATDPTPLAQICRAAQVPHVFVDHPCDDAPSIMTDNRQGTRRLTDTMLARMQPGDADDPVARLYFIGGDSALPATQQRIAGFRDAMDAQQTPLQADQIIACGYDVDRAEAALVALEDRLGRLPRGLLVNSILCFEGIVRHLARLPEADIAGTVLGCFDYDPFGKLLRFPVIMVRQRADLLIQEAFKRLDDNDGAASLSLVSPDLIL